MAELSMTVTNYINLFGGQLTYKWGTGTDQALVYGSGRYGDGDNMFLTITKVAPNTVILTEDLLTKEVTKVYSDSIVVSNVVYKEATKFIDNIVVHSSAVYKEPTKVIDNSVTLTDAYYKEFEKVIDGSVTVSGDMNRETKYNGIWAYAVEGDSTNYEDRPTNTWTAGSDAATSFTSGSDAGTVWT